MSTEKGQTLLEVVVVISVGVTVLSAIVFATIASLRNAQFAKNQAQATKLAQEGIERVRTGRDRNALVTIPPIVTSWNGNPGGTLWDYKIFDNCGITGDCYLKFSSTAGSDIIWIDTSETFPEVTAEAIPPAPATTLFKRAIILSDTASAYDKEKKVTVLVRWTDFSGPHESRLTTILRRI